MTLSRRKVRFLSKEYRKVQNLYLASFPAVERLPYFLLVLNTYRHLANFYAYYDDESFVGLAYLLENEEIVYLFFLAVNPQLHSHGYGSAILQDIKIIAEKRHIILAVEPLDKEAENYRQRIKRVAFYEKNGFTLTDYEYHEGKEIYQIMTTSTLFDLSSVASLTQKAVLGLINTAFKKKDDS